MNRIHPQNAPAQHSAVHRVAERTAAVCVGLLLLAAIAGCAGDAGARPGAEPSRAASGQSSAAADPAEDEPADDSRDPMEAYPRSQGGTLWVVALAVSVGQPEGYTPDNDSKLKNAKDDLTERTDGRYAAEYVFAECDKGAREGLGLDDPDKTYVYTAVYFASDRTAWRFVKTYSLKPVGVAKVEPVKDC